MLIAHRIHAMQIISEINNERVEDIISIGDKIHIKGEGGGRFEATGEVVEFVESEIDGLNVGIKTNGNERFYSLFEIHEITKIID